MCFWGNSEIYAELRREFCWGDLVLVVFEILGVDSRECVEEGGTIVFPPCVWVNLMCQFGNLFGGWF
jgi:hypothetical protein